MLDEELSKIIKENRETLEKMDKRMHRIEKKFVWNTIFGFLKVLIIWGPIIGGLIYFTPVLKDYVKIFDPIVNTLRSVSSNNSETDQLKGEINQMDYSLELFCEKEAREAMADQLCK
ncbi:hypothetical protein K8R42_01800 [bacterium]|nr:hypothetical protein [bacterium]